MALIGPIYFDFTAIVLIAFFTVFFLFMAIFHKSFGHLLAKYNVWYYRFWSKQKNNVGQTYAQFLKKLSMDKFETEKIVRLSQTLVLVMSLLGLIVLALIVVYGVFFQ